ncbi:hypothetical protein L6164_002514 [Bauhinia variegata]|uniref:Uncharacterized protein n=1 Tax=Bauhinia variegata TaxID=167791 RepID=A0ACB9PYG8_BAUVA|nr:hypothetical protein L6164_002514 [Bauhinia variegata]
MEDDKKKRKGKKKKNKQSKTAGDGVTAVGETTSGDPNLVNHGKGDEHSQLLEIADVQSRNVVDSNGHGPNGKQCVNSEETIKKLKEENDLHVKKEAIFQETIRKLKEENDMHIQKEAMSEETARQLREQIEMCNQKEAGLVMRIAQFQSEKDSLIQKEAGLQAKVNQFLNEKSNLSQQVESFEERVKLLEGDLSSSIERESSAKETILNLNGDVSRLQVQLAVLEDSRNSLLVENQRLMENVSSLQLAIQNLEKNRSSSSRTVDASAKDNVSELEDLKNQIEAARTLVEKLVDENAGLVEKVNELYAELDKRSATAELSGATVPDGITEYAESAGVAIPIPESEEITPVSAEKFNSLENVPVQDKNDTVDVNDVAGVVSDSIVSDSSGEIVQIPLDDNEVRDQEELEDAKNVEEEAVPLTDAPLIGAPFRLISFVAKFVSGADLVNKSNSDDSR